MKNDLDVSTLLMLLSFSWLMPMVKSTLLLLLIRVPSSPTLLFVRICCSCLLNETFSVTVGFHMQIDGKRTGIYPGFVSLTFSESRGTRDGL